MEVKIDAESVKGFVAEAVLRSLDAEARERLIRQAIEHLLKPQESPFGARSERISPLEVAFRQAVEMVARKMVAEQVASDPAISEAIGKLVAAGIRRLEERSSDPKVSDAIADTIGKWITGER